LTNVQSQVAQMQDEIQTAYLVAAIGVAVGIIGIAVGALAIARGSKKKGK